MRFFQHSLGWVLALILGLPPLLSIAGPSVGETQEPKLISVNVMLDWLINPDHVPLVVAQQQGFFKQRGLKVNLISPTNSADPLKLVAAGKVDIALTYQPQMMVGVSRDLPLLRFATLIATPLNALAVLQSSGINDLHDLKDKRIGYTPGGTDDIFLNSLLAQAGLTPADVSLVNVNFNLVQALLTEKVDAVIGIMRNVELVELRAQGKSVHAFFPEEHGVPIYDELIFVTHRDRSSAMVLSAFVSALNKATQFVVNHPETSWQEFVNAYPENDNAINQQIWAATYPRFSLMPGALDASRYQNLATYLISTGTVKALPPLDHYAQAMMYTQSP